MSDSQDPDLYLPSGFPSEASPIERVLGVWRIDKRASQRAFAQSTVGHLIHYIINGSYTLITNGRKYRIQQGDVIYYYGRESVEWIGDDIPVSFYSIAFHAKNLEPLPIESRKFSATDEQARHFEIIYHTSREVASSNRDMKMMGNLLCLLASLIPNKEDLNYKDDLSMIWWKLEQHLRENKIYKCQLQELESLSGKSRSTIVRSCRKAVGDSPLNRIKKIRMDEARGLLSYSDMSITEVAESVGYERIHDFSRDFSKVFKCSPRSFRQNQG